MFALLYVCVALYFDALWSVDYITLYVMCRVYSC
jgi:hypothetical protein